MSTTPREQLLDLAAKWRKREGAYPAFGVCAEDIERMIYPDLIQRSEVLTSRDVEYLRSSYSEDWRPGEVREVCFPSGVRVPRDTFADFVSGQKVYGKKP